MGTLRSSGWGVKVEAAALLLLLLLCQPCPIPDMEVGAEPSTLGGFQTKPKNPICQVDPPAPPWGSWPILPPGRDHLGSQHSAHASQDSQGTLHPFPCSWHREERAVAAAWECPEPMKTWLVLPPGLSPNPIGTHLIPAGTLAHPHRPREPTLSPHTLAGDMTCPSPNKGPHCAPAWMWPHPHTPSCPHCDLLTSPQGPRHVPSVTLPHPPPHRAPSTSLHEPALVPTPTVTHTQRHIPPGPSPHPHVHRDPRVPTRTPHAAISPQGPSCPLTDTLPSPQGPHVHKDPHIPSLTL